MKSFAVLLALAVLTECLGADRSRQRSPIRSVPVAASVKREVDFDCPEEFGYYPHPTDCTLYYVCVFGGALLESCTGGLMYSHELQTCDWPRNVGCDATGAVITDDYERLNERRPPPPPPPRRNPPPPPSSRAQPNPIITSRGQPKFNRQEYEKQQQLYAEVDDLPPVEEIESDRQQRVYRGQPSTIGQVQKDRDGYHGSQGVSSGRTINSNIIPSSISQNSKIGSFSFGTQVDDRRTATATQAPQTYREDMYNVLTDSSDITKDFSTGESTIKAINENRLSRKKREVVGSAANVSKIPDEISKRSDNDEEMEYIEFDPESDEEEEEYQDDILDESERGKRQIRFYLKDGQKIPVKLSNSKPFKFINLQHYNYNPKPHNPRYQSIYNGGVNGDSYNPFLTNNNNQYSVNPLSQIDNFQNQRPFKASLRDPTKLKYPGHNPVSQIITKSPPISSLNNNQNPFASLAGGFFNNGLKENPNNNIISQGQVSSTNRPNLISFPDSSQLPSAVVTGRPIPSTILKDNKPIKNTTKDQKQMTNNHDYNEDEDYSEEDEDSLENDEDDKQKFSFSSFNIPYSFTHPRNKYANIDNPFAKPDFNFDEFLSKLRDDHYSVVGVSTQKPLQNNAVRIMTNEPTHTTPFSNTNNKQSIYFKGISTPKPFTMPDEPINDNITFYQTVKNSISNQMLNSEHKQRQQASLNSNGHFFQDNSNDNGRLLQKDARTPLDTLRPKLKPPNFKDDRQLPISYSFNTPTESSIQPPYSNQQMVTPTPYYTVTKNTKMATFQPNYANSVKPYLISTSQPMNLYVLGLSQSTLRPSTFANEQLSALQNYWKTPSTGVTFSTPPSVSPNTVTEIAKWTKLYLEAIQPSTKIPFNNQKTVATTTAKAPPKRKPIPKPSPEMNDYYYDEEDEQYYHEPSVKSKYMPSSEVMPQRPPMAQNYQEYDDFHENSQNPSNVKHREKIVIPNRQNNYKPKGVTKNHNDVSVVTKSPYKQSNKNSNAKIPVPVMIDYDSAIKSMLINLRNRTYHIRKPNRPENNPNTLKPPKYLNQTTLRPYTVRHRLAKPTTEKEYINQDEDIKQNRGRIRHHNIVAEMKLTTPHDSFKQETRITKTGHDDKTNSLEPTESVTPSSYSPSPRPKMLYNGSQSYSPDQYDPYYAVYDEDGELYKDTDYVQQYNSASLRPAVQQTYRGTPPPPRRPVETYSPRPVSDVVDDYDDALIRGPINNQNQYQTAVRQPSRPTSTRGRGSAHFSTSGGSDAPQQAPNRGTPPTRSRLTLKPSTAIITKTVEKDIYANPPTRPEAVYPQPTPDKTAAKCRKDVCLLPDCFCGGKDIPGDLPVDKVPQIVLLTFDDSVNDLNKGLYSDLFEKGRVNPNGCPITATFYVSHEWTDYSQVQNLYSVGHEMASHTVSHSFGEQFSQKKWHREVGGQREILAAYGGVKLEDVRGMRAPFLSVGGNKMFKMLYDSNFTYDSSLPVYENRPPSWPYTLDYKLFHDCMIPPCPTKSYPGVWEVPMVMWQDLNGGRCSMGDACANPPDAEGVYKMILKNFDRHYTSNRAPFGLFYHAAWFTQPHHKEGFIMFLDFINKMNDVWIITNWQALQWVRDPTPISRLNNFQPFQCNYPDRPKKCNNPKVCNLWHKSGVRYMRSCQPCPQVYPWTGKTGISSSRIDKEIEE